MSYITISTEKNETYSSISNLFIDHYMTHANGEFVKIYLYLVRLMSYNMPVSVAEIADHFNLTEKDICRAIKYWISQDVMKLNYNANGELTGITLLPLEEKKNDSDMLSRDNIALFKIPADKAANKTVNEKTDNEKATNKKNKEAASTKKAIPNKQNISPELISRFEQDTAFSDIIFEAETYFCKELSSKDIESLIYIYDSLKFPFELVEYLIEYCASINKNSVRYAEVVAHSWYQQGITTKEAAIESVKSYNPLYRPVFKQLGIERSVPTTIESAYIDTWYEDMQFDLPLILEACKKAIIQKPTSANFAYVNGILENWHKNNVKSLKDVERLDKEFAKQKTFDKLQAKDIQTRSRSFETFAKRDNNAQLDEMEKLFLQEINHK